MSSIVAAAVMYHGYVTVGIFTHAYIIMPMSKRHINGSYMRLCHHMGAVVCWMRDL